MNILDIITNIPTTGEIRKEGATVTFSRKAGMLYARVTEPGEDHSITLECPMENLKVKRAERYPTLECFTLPYGPYVLGFTYGGDWNGWALPLLERDSLRRWAREFNEADEAAFHLRPNGDAVYSIGPDDDDPRVIEPQRLTYAGHTYTVYDVSLAMCWMGTPLDDFHEIDLDELQNMVIPRCLPHSPALEKLEALIQQDQPGEIKTVASILGGTPYCPTNGDSSEDWQDWTGVRLALWQIELWGDLTLNDLYQEQLDDLAQAAIRHAGLEPDGGHPIHGIAHELRTRKK